MYNFVNDMVVPTMLEKSNRYFIEQDETNPQVSIRYLLLACGLLKRRKVSAGEDDCEDDYNEEENDMT